MQGVPAGVRSSPLYQESTEYYERKALRHTRRKRAAIRRLICDAKAVPCADCGNTFPYYVMDFDHVHGVKRFNIGRGLSSWTVEDVRQEIAKCEVVCANCHRIREHERKRVNASPPR